MQSQTIPSSLLVFLADPILSPGQIPNEINLARLNLAVALTLCAPATQPLKQSDIGGCSASVTPRMTKIERRAGPSPWRVRSAMTAKFFPRSSVRIANVRRQPREDNTVRVWDAPITETGKNRGLVWIASSSVSTEGCQRKRIWTEHSTPRSASPLSQPPVFPGLHSLVMT